LSTRLDKEKNWESGVSAKNPLSFSVNLCTCVWKLLFLSEKDALLQLPPLIVTSEKNKNTLEVRWKTPLKKESDENLHGERSDKDFTEP
jgi:hypothetical protein